MHVCLPEMSLNIITTRQLHVFGICTAKLQLILLTVFNLK